MLSAYFPWYYNSRSISVVDSEEDVNSGFTHKIYSKHKPVSSYHQLVFPILTEALDKVNQECLSLIRIRAGMFTRNLNNNLPHAPHIDYTFEHTTLLYYVNDSDGPTRFYKGDKIIKEVIPRKGTAVLFPFGSYHSSSDPIETPVRVTLNYNFLCTK